MKNGLVEYHSPYCLNGKKSSSYSSSSEEVTLGNLKTNKLIGQGYNMG